MATLRVIEDSDGYGAERLDAAILSFEEVWAKENDPWAKSLKQALDDVKRELGSCSDDEQTRHPLFEDFEEINARTYPATQWLVTGVISRGGIAMFGAEPKSCKTWLLTEVAVSVATGTRVCGEFVSAAGIVAYFFAEDQGPQVKTRVGAIAAGKGIPVSDVFGKLFACPRGKFLDITRDEDVAWIVASCRKIGRVDLVILDPLRDISSAAEDKSDEMSPVMRRLRLIGELLSCTVAVAHHAGKPSKDTEKRRPGQRMRGSSAIYGSTDSGIYFGLREGGDGVSKFELEVDVEIKGGRSAGNMGLVLDVEDNGDGAATKAVWTMPDGTARRGRKRSVAEENDDQAFTFIRQLAMRGEVCSARKLRDHEENPLADHAMRDALARLIKKGRLTKDDDFIIRVVAKENS